MINHSSIIYETNTPSSGFLFLYKHNLFYDSSKVQWCIIFFGDIKWMVNNTSLWINKFLPTHVALSCEVTPNEPFSVFCPCLYKTKFLRYLFGLTWILCNIVELESKSSIIGLEIEQNVQSSKAWHLNVTWSLFNLE